MAQPGRATTETAALGFARSRFGCGDESSRRLECGQTAGVTPCAQQRDPAPVRFSPTIGSCGPVRPLGSTAGCVKAHVRWCGRVPGRNPRHSTRSGLPAPQILAWCEDSQVLQYGAAWAVTNWRTIGPKAGLTAGDTHRLKPV